MPRIGIDARSLAQNNIGAGTYLRNILKYFPGLDSENEYYLYSNELIPSGMPDSFHSRNIRIPGVPFSIAWINLRLPLALIRDRIDLLHCPFYSYPFIRPCPTIVTIHDIVFEALPLSLPLHKTVALRSIFGNAARTARKIIAVSEFTKQEILKHYRIDEDRISVIYEAADERFKPMKDKNRLDEIKQKYGLSGGFIIHVGAIHTRRNISRLLKAFRSVSEKHKDAKLLLIGKQIFAGIDLRAEIKALGLENRVIHIDYVPDEDLMCLYNAAELLVYSSLYEGFGLPMVEAMACGTPIVASNISVMPEILGGAGVLFDPYDPDNMADKISMVLNDDAIRRELSAGSIKRAAEFSWRTAAERTVQAYKEALRG